MRRTVRRWVAVSLFTPLAFGATSAMATVPGTLTHQGRLYDASNKPINATLSVQFAMYADANTLVSLWTETDMVTFDDGYFSVSIGEATPFPANLFDGTVRFIGITVGADPEMAPRPPVQSVPYAMVAGDAIGDIHPASVSIDGATVIDSGGKWVGDVAGLQGPQGVQGPQGLQGPQGPAGATGATGTTGAQGTQGAAGATGAAGAAGAQGAAGPAGGAGPAGAQGPVGPQGPAGAAGATGAQGTQGAAGPAGSQGPAGPIGPQGAAGPAGAQGPAGPQGSQGAAGATGAQGTQGAAGPQGVAGPAGAAGAAGPQGPQGAAGAQGPVGPTGPSDPTAFIQNQSSSAQAASFEIAGSGQLQTLTVNGDVTVGGRVAIGIYTQTCAPNTAPYDCACNAGDFAVGGGGFAFQNGGNVLRESDPTPGNPNAWRVTCSVVNGGSSSFDNKCQGAYAVCLSHAQ